MNTTNQSKGLFRRREGLDFRREPHLSLEEGQKGEVGADPLAGVVLERVGKAAGQGHPHRLPSNVQVRFLAHG